MTQLTLSHPDVGMLIYSEAFQARTPRKVEIHALPQAKGHMHLFKQWSPIEIRTQNLSNIIKNHKAHTDTYLNPERQTRHRSEERRVGKEC